MLLRKLHDENSYHVFSLQSISLSSHISLKALISPGDFENILEYLRKSVRSPTHLFTYFKIRFLDPKFIRYPLNNCHLISS